MSLILVYFEIGSKIPLKTPEMPFVAYPTAVNLKNNKLTRQAYAITDGHSSECFLAYGKKVIAREGAKLRKSFAEYVSKRITFGFDPYFAMVSIRGLISDPITLKLEDKIDVRLVDLESTFINLEINRIIHVIGEDE